MKLLDMSRVSIEMGNQSQVCIGASYRGQLSQAVPHWVCRRSTDR